MEKIKTALQYAANNWSVLPLHNIRQQHCSCGQLNCKSPGKHPRTFHGLKDATADEHKIAAWWGRWPDANIGIATGEVSSLVVLDIDPDKGGDKSLRDLITSHTPLPQTLSQRTGAGEHYFFNYPEQTIKCSASKLGKGIDIRADGGYIVVAPSDHISGNHYKWLTTFDLIAPLPEWLLILITTKTTDKIIPGVISEGERNNYLMSVGGKMRTDGKRKNEIKTYLLEENQLRCQPPLDADEVKKIADSLGRYPKGKKPKEIKYQYLNWLRSEVSPVPSVLRLILYNLTCWMNEEGRSCYPTIKDIAVTTGYSESTVKKQLTLAVNNGWIGRYAHSGEGQQWRNYGYYIPPDLLKVG